MIKVFELMSDPLNVFSFGVLNKFGLLPKGRIIEKERKIIDEKIQKAYEERIERNLPPEMNILDLIVKHNKECKD